MNSLVSNNAQKQRKEKPIPTVSSKHGKAEFSQIAKCPAVYRKSEGLLQGNF